MSTLKENSDVNGSLISPESRRYITLPITAKILGMGDLGLIRAVKYDRYLTDPRIPRHFISAAGITFFRRSDVDDAIIARERAESPLCMTLPQAARTLGISQSVLRHAVNDDRYLTDPRIPRHFKFGGITLFLRSDIADAINARGIEVKFEAYPDFKIPHSCSFSYLSVLYCCTEETVRKTVKKLGWQATYRLPNKTKKEFFKSDVISILPPKKAKPKPIVKKATLAEVVYLAQFRREKMYEKAEKIVNELSGKWNGRKGMCKCPAHADSSPSLSVSVSEESGKLLVHCFSGCHSSEVIDTLRGLNLWPSSSGRRRRSRGQNTQVHQLPIKKPLTEHEYAFGRRDREIGAEIASMFAWLNNASERADEARNEIDNDFERQKAFEEWADEEVWKYHFMYEAVA
ncbi:hypothetical protein N9Y67_02000 [Pseudomonadota bacterium]|nr:hypothetical protein [Pseudomonadota bacterium]